MAVAVATFFPALTAFASGESTAPAVKREAWAWIGQRDGMPSLHAATGVEEGQLPVAWVKGEDKVTFIDVAPPLNPAGRLTVTLAVDASAQNHAVSEAELVICAVTQPWETGSPMAWDRQPDRNCEEPSQGVYQPASNDFFFDVSGLLPVLDATGWHGLIVAPDPMTAAPVFQVVFQSAVRGGAEFTYGAPPDAGVPTGENMAPPSSLHEDQDAPPLVAMDALPTGASPEPDRGVATIPSVGETYAAAPAAPEPLEDLASESTGQRMPASFAGFYAGMAALAMVLTARPAIAAARGVLRAGTGHGATGARNAFSGGAVR